MEDEEQSLSDIIDFCYETKSRREEVKKFTIDVRYLPVETIRKGFMETRTMLGFVVPALILSFPAACLDVPSNMFPIHLIILSVAVIPMLFVLGNFVFREEIRITPKLVYYKRRGLFGRKEWEKALSDFRGILLQKKRFSLVPFVIGKHFYIELYADNATRILLFNWPAKWDWVHKRLWHSFAVALKLPALEINKGKIMEIPLEDTLTYRYANRPSLDWPPKPESKIITAPYTCRSCGAVFAVSSDTPEAVCEHCGTSVTIETVPEQLDFLSPEKRAAIEALKRITVDAAISHTWVQIYDSDLNDEDLVHLSVLTDLWRIDIAGCEITGTGLVYIRDLPKLRALVLPRTHLDDRGMVHMKNLRTLEELDLSDTRITDSGLSKLARLTGLKKLNISETEVSDEGLSHLIEMSALKHLNITNTLVTEEGIIRLCSVSHLENIFFDTEHFRMKPIFEAGGARFLKNNPAFYSLENQSLEDGDLVFLEDLRNINILFLNNNSINGPGLKYIKKFNNLEMLFLIENPLTDDGLQYLQGMMKLKELNLSSTRVTDEGLRYLQGLENLKELSLNSTRITDEGLRCLQGLKNLKELSLINTPVTARGADWLKQEIPGIQISISS